MQIFVSRLKQVSALTFWVLALVVVCVVGALVWVICFRGKRKTDIPITAIERQTQAAIKTAVDKIMVANAVAAIEVKAARTKDEGTRAALNEALAEPDAAHRRRRLIDLSNQIDRE